MYTYSLNNVTLCVKTHLLIVIFYDCHGTATSMNMKKYSEAVAKNQNKKFRAVEKQVLILGANDVS